MSRTIGGFALLCAMAASLLLGTAGAAPLARSTPDWVKDGVIYEIYPRAFSARGDLKGITAQLDQLKDLGVSILWLMPIHPIGQKARKGSIGSPYAVRDYLAVNPAYGTKGDLKRLVAEAHRRGMRVILDVVFNHTSWDNALVRQHPDYFKRDPAGKVLPPIADWTDVAGLNYDSPQLRRYVIDVLQHWVREADVDGYRVDVACWMPIDFWEQARDALQPLRPDIFMLAEADKPEYLVKAFDADYAWAFHTELTRVLLGVGPAAKLRQLWEQERAKWPVGALRMRFSDNHDERRATLRFGERAALAASALVFTLDGVPLLYNGMEVGDGADSGAPALFERLPVFWQGAERRPWVRPFYKELIALRAAHPALRRGETVWLKNSAEAQLLTYLRKSKEEELLVAINLSSVPVKGSVVLPDARGFEEITPKVPVPILPQASQVEFVKTSPVRLPGLEVPSWGMRVLRRVPRR